MIVATRSQNTRSSTSMSASALDQRPAADRGLLLGDGIFGPYIDYMTGHEHDPDVRRRFRAWFAQMLIEHVARS